MTTQKFEVIEIGLGTKTDQTKYRLKYDERCYRARLQRVSKDKDNPLDDVVPMHFEIVTREHPMLGDTYTLTFSKDNDAD